MLCQYKDIFGIPGQGIHKYRIFNIAIFDVLITLIFAFIISYVFNINLIITIVLLFLSGIIVHRIFCVRTTVDKLLFPSESI
jgi:hypothetical protein